MMAGSNFLETWKAGRVTVRDGCLFVGDTPAMFEWERPLMGSFAAALEVAGSDILEIGFGLGIFATEVQSLRPRSHVIVEAHAEIAARARIWARCAHFC